MPEPRAARSYTKGGVYDRLWKHKYENNAQSRGNFTRATSRSYDHEM